MSWFDELPEAIRAARARIEPHILTTPVSHAHWLPGLDVQLKCEHLQHTGSFKLRGALNRLLTLDAETRDRGIIAASTGNHGQGIARAAQVAGVRATVYVPESAAAVKISPMRAMGVKVTAVPGDGLAAELAARAAAEDSGQLFVSPYNDAGVVAGQGTIGLELIEALGELDAVFVSVGGGGLISGIGAYLKSVHPGLRLVGCWPENAPAMARCLDAGEIRPVVEQPTVSDGTAGGIEAGAITFASCAALIDEQVLVSESEIAAAMVLLAEQERWLVEGAAGVALAACLKRAKAYAGARVAVVLCGRNIALDKFLQVTGISQRSRG